MERVQGTGKTVEEAVENALSQLGVTADEAEITVESTGNKGLFGLGAKPALVTAVKKQSSSRNKAADFIVGVCERMGARVDIEETETEDGYKLTLRSNSMGMLIGYRGDTLDALQYLANLAANRNASEYKRIMLDSENYRSKRQRTLERLATKYASRARATGRSVSLEPMKPYERRVLHAALQNNEYVTTYSEGEEPYRRVVIKPK
jgi:spoIIIJ-associated protein